jgi:hypothetical protein
MRQEQILAVEKGLVSGERWGGEEKLLLDGWNDA